MTGKALTKVQIDELLALAETCEAKRKAGLEDGYSALHRSHWWGLYSKLVGAGYVVWTKWPSDQWSRSYAKVRPTEAGLALLKEKGLMA